MRYDTWDTLQVWTANTDSEEEGVWRDRYSGQVTREHRCVATFSQAISHAPWPADRPYDGGFAYNCMMLEVRQVAGAGSAVPQVTLEEKEVKPVLSSRLYFGTQSLSGGTIQDEECSVSVAVGDNHCDPVPDGVLQRVRGVLSLPEDVSAGPLPPLPLRQALHLCGDGEGRGDVPRLQELSHSI